MSRILGIGLLLLAPVRLSAQAEKPETPEAAVDLFMKAVADSNLGRMMQLWGTQKGSAAATKRPANYQKRMYITYAYLKGGTYRIAASEPVPQSDDKRAMLVEFKRGDCNKMVPVRAVKTKKEGWIVNSIDLSAVGVPGRSCGEAPRSLDSAPASAN